MMSAYVLPGMLAGLREKAPGLQIDLVATNDIRDLLHDGQSVVVQVEKDPISSKGARLSTQLALASKYLVLMPNEEHIGISQRQIQVDQHRR